MLESVQSEVPFVLREIAIDGDVQLEASHRERVPVVTIDGGEAFSLFVYPDALRRRLLAR